MPVRVTENSITEGSRGLITNASAADVSENSFRVLKNARQKKFGLFENLLGYGTAQIRSEGSLVSVPSLPVSFALEKAWVFHRLIPSDGDYVLLFGSKAGRDRFYVWPNIVSGAWNTAGDWLELTEAESGTITAVASSTGYTVSGLSQSTADYYSRWWAFIWNSAGTVYRGTDFILSNTSGNVMSTKFGVSGITVSPADKIVLMRFPIFQKDDAVTPYYLVDDLPTIRKDGEELTIFTGAHDMDSGPDLWLGVIGTSSANVRMFNDAELAYNGWYMTQAHPWRIWDRYAFSSLGVASGSTDPMPWTSGTDYYIVDITGVYDGDQESRLRFDKADNTASPNFPQALAVSAADQHITGTLSFDPREDFIRMSDNLAGQVVSFSGPYPFMWDRRVRKLRIYVADAVLRDAGTALYQASSDFFFVKEIDVNDSGWSPTAGVYALSFTIKGTEYRAAQEFPFAKVNGFQVQLTGANAKFGVQVGNRSVVFPIYDDNKKFYRGLYSPIRYFGEAGVNVMPRGFRLDVTQYEGEITGGTEFQGKLVLFSPRRLMTAYVTGENRGQILESFQRKGLASYRTVKVIEGLLYFASQDSPLEAFDGSNFASPSPGYFIKDVWDALTPAQKLASFSGYYHTGKLYVVKMGSRIFMYDVEQRIWAGEYETALTFVDFVEGHDGQLYGATASAFVELFAATPTESLAMTLETKVWNGQERDVVKARLQYKSDVLLKWIPIDDTQPSTLREGDPALFLAQANMESQDFPVSLKTNRFAVRLTSAASMDGNIEIEDLGFAETVQPEK